MSQKLQTLPAFFAFFLCTWQTNADKVILNQLLLRHCRCVHCHPMRSERCAIDGKSFYKQHWRERERERACCTPPHSLGPLTRLSPRSAPPRTCQGEPRSAAPSVIIAWPEISSDALCAINHRVEAKHELIRSQPLKGLLYPWAGVLGLDPYCH